LLILSISSVSNLTFVDLQHREKSLLRYLDAADLFYSLFTFFLFFEQFTFARDVAAVALGDDVFSQHFDRAK